MNDPKEPTWSAEDLWSLIQLDSAKEGDSSGDFRTAESDRQYECSLENLLYREDAGRLSRRPCIFPIKIHPLVYAPNLYNSARREAY